MFHRTSIFADVARTQMYTHINHTCVPHMPHIVRYKTGYIISRYRTCSTYMSYCDNSYIDL